jgi:hypothetical protein
LDLSTDDKLFEFIKTAEQAYEPMRTQLGQSRGVAGCYYEEIQWLGRNAGSVVGSYRDGTIRRYPLDYSPEASKLRVIDNDLTALVQKSAASTNPGEIHVDCYPPERDTGPEAAFRARVHETLINTAIDDSKYLDAAEAVNFRRCIFGTQGMGLAIESEGGGQYICAFEFDPTCLILDPTCQKRNLQDHPYVIYSDCWPLEKIEAVFNVKLDPEKCKTMEQLEAQKMEWNALSERKLYTKHARYSKSKAARFYQVHNRTGRRFGEWHVVVEDGGGEKKTVVSGPTPFGGAGMPLMLQHGHPRADSMWSLGEVDLIKNDQDQKNLAATQKGRIEQNYAHARPIVDRRWFSGNATDDDILKQFTNRIGQPLIGNGSDRQRNAQAPFFAPMPPPPQFLHDSLDRYAARMVRKTHKAPGNFGETPTHVPFATTERVLDDAGQVDTVRMASDLRAHEYLIGVLHATTIKLVKAKNGPTAVMLRKTAGFNGQDFATILQADEQYPEVTFEINRSAYRTRSPQARKQDLDGAAKLQMIDVESYQAALADLGLPLTEESRQMVDQAERAALKIIYGEEWMPKPLGSWSMPFIKVFTRAQFDPATEENEGATLRLVGAIQAIYKMWYEEQLLANPEMAMKASAPGGEPQAGQPVEPEQPQAASVSDVLSALSQGGGSAVGAQPASAA